ncbi:MAG: cell division protein FtsI/penicillin-binding protein 2 [Akkermansiaceae bacterium]|jgi:cell division protein FtsI/penicillin-binding protein 2
MDPSFKRRAFIVCLALVAGLTALSFRLITLQVWDRKMSDKSSVPQFKMQETIPASRGLIVDRNQTVIAQNRPEATLVANLNHLHTVDILKKAVTHRYASQGAGWKNLNHAERDFVLREARKKYVTPMSKQQLIDEHLAYATEIIGREFRIPSAELKRKVEKGSIRTVVRKGIQEDLARRLETELQKRSIQGFNFERSQRRYYPMPTFAPHLIGFKNHQGVSECGLEKWMEEILAGRDGRRELKRDENGLVNLTEAAEVNPPMMGKHVKTTLDMDIQAIVEEELGMAFDAYNAKAGSILVVDPHTGDMLAMASRPHFNLNIRENYANAGTSFAVSAQYEAGSVMKIIAMAAALESGGVTRDTVVDCGWGELLRHGFVIKDHHRYNELTFDGVLVKSSNTGVFQFAERVGPAGFYDYLDAFGFGQRTGFPIPGEAKGRIQDRTNMRNFASATYGYGVSVTPLQLAMAYSVLANGGTLLKPRLIDSVIAHDGRQLESMPVQKVRRVLSERTARGMCLALEQVVLKGTGRRAKVPGYRSGGKTGTSEKWDNKAKIYQEDKKFVTFVGILPVHDPRFVCVVTIDEPSGLGEDFQIGGGTVAAPLFAQVAGRIARLMNITPTEELPENEDSIALNPTQ